MLVVDSVINGSMYSKYAALEAALKLRYSNRTVSTKWQFLIE